MVLKNTPFNHEYQEFFSCISNNGKAFTQARERVIFSTLANAHMVNYLYENPDDAPLQIKTTSGDLELAIKDVTDPLEYELILLCFHKYHAMALEGFKFWRVMNDTGEGASERKLKLNILLNVLKLQNAEEKKKAESSDNFLSFDTNVPYIEIEDVMKRVDLCVSANYNYEKYLELLTGGRDTTFGESVLKKLF